LPPEPPSSQRGGFVEVSGLRSGLLGRVVSPRGVQLVATRGLLNDRTENHVVTNVTIFNYSVHMPSDASFKVDNQPYQLASPVNYIAPGVPLWLRGGSAFTTALCILSPSFIVSLADSESALRLDKIDYLTSIESERLTYLGQVIFREAIEPGFASSLVAETMGIAIALEIARCASARRSQDEPRRGGLADWQKRRLDSYIRDNLSNDLTLHELAMLLGVSIRHLSRVVRQSTGISVHRWIANYRLAEARRLLAETELSIQDVSQRVALHSAAAFTTAFRAASGFSPIEFRRLTRGA
jgi:AraC-like DNA-binding protein